MKKDLYRKKLKEIYKNKLREDISNGKVKQQLIHAVDVAKQSKNEEQYKLKLNELQEFLCQTRFREDFPTFSSFKKFVKSAKLTLKDFIDS